MEKAACRGVANRKFVEGDPFFPGRGGTSDEAVLGYCIWCKVRRECDDYADRVDAKVGVWGGKRRTRTTHGPISERRPGTYERRAA
jgi:hypothetical protein